MKGNDINVSMSEMRGPAHTTALHFQRCSLHNSCPCHGVLVAKRKNKKQLNGKVCVKDNYLAVVLGEYNLV